MLEFFLSHGKIACILPYLDIIHIYGSKYNKKNLKELSTFLGRKKASVNQQLIVLKELGILEDHENGWMYAIGKKKFNVARGICHSKMVNIPDEILVDVKKLRTFAYSVCIGQASTHIKTRVKHFNKLHSEGETPEGFQHDLYTHNAGDNKSQTKWDSVPISGSYMKAFKDTIGRTVFTWNNQRKKAAKLGLLEIERDYEIHLTGGIEVKMQCIHDRAYLQNGFKHTWKKTEDGRYLWLIEKPTRVKVDIPIKKQIHNYSPTQKLLIKKNYLLRDISRF